MKSFRSLWLRAGVLTFAALMLGTGTAFAAAPAQVENSIFDNLIFVVIGGVLLALLAALAGGALIAALASFGSKFFRRNLPTDEEMSMLRAELNPPQKAQRKPFKLTARNEPILLALGMFVASFVLVNLFLAMTPQTVQGSEGGSPGEAADQPVPAAALPREGDFTQIVSELPAGNPDNGTRLYNAKGCVGCHSLEKDKRLVGPTFYNVYEDAKVQVPELGPTEYLYQSIVNPNAHIVATYQSNLMPQTYAQQFTPQEMADMLAWFERDHQGQP
jgi:mono/diheme cytochrome c family protein